MNTSISYQNNKSDLAQQISTFLEMAIQPVIGLLIILLNIGLIIFHKRKAGCNKATFTILSNLTISDIIFGSMFVLRFILILVAPKHLTEICRFIFGFGAVISTTMSGWCIFLLSCQVSGYHTNRASMDFW